MTHEDIRTLLPAYAAGALDETGSNAVRAHMATGCTECLREVFRRPIGLPLEPERDDSAAVSSSGAAAAMVAARDRPAPEPVPTPMPPVVAPVEPIAPAPAEPVAMVQAPPTAGRGPGMATFLIVALALALVALAAWMVADMRRQVAVQRTEASRLAARLSEAESARATLAARIQTLERDLDRDLAAAQADAARQADAVRMSAEESAQVKRDLEAAQQRIASLTWTLRQRETEAQRQAADSEEDETLRGLVSAPGLELLALRAVPPFQDVRGHVLWKPGDTMLRLYAFDLPALPEGGSYRVRVGANGGELESGPAFQPGGHGSVELAIRLRTPASRVCAVEIVIEPGAEPVLAGRS